LTIPVSRHCCLDPSLIIELCSWIVWVLAHGSLINIWLRDHLMILKRSQMVQVVILNLVVGLVLSFVHLNICDRVRVLQYW